MTETNKKLFKMIWNASMIGKHRPCTITDVITQRRPFEMGVIRRQIWDIQREYLIKLGVLGSQEDVRHFESLFVDLSTHPPLMFRQDPEPDLAPTNQVQQQAITGGMDDPEGARREDEPITITNLTMAIETAD